VRNPCLFVAIGLVLATAAGGLAAQGITTYVDRMGGFIMAHPSDFQILRGGMGGSLFLISAANDTLVDMRVVKLRDEGVYASSLDRWRDFAVDRMLEWILGGKNGRECLGRLTQFTTEHDVRVVEAWVKTGSPRSGAHGCGPYFALDITTSAQTAALLVEPHPTAEASEATITVTREIIENIRPLLTGYRDETRRPTRSSEKAN